MNRMATGLSLAQYRQLRSRAEKLRKRGLSYKEILKKVPVSKSTISQWCRNIKLTRNQIIRLGSLYDKQLRGAKVNQRKSLERRERVRLLAIQEIPKLTTDMLKIAGAMLYWAEGDKGNGTQLANSDPACVVFYVRWLHKVFNIPPGQLTISMHLHRGQSEYKERGFWSKITGIPVANFRKTFYKPEGRGHRKNILYHGTVKIRVQGTGLELLRHRILGWTEAVARQLVSGEIIRIHYRGRTMRR